MSRKAETITFLSSIKAYALCELAPFQYMTVAGLHRAHPSTSLDKSLSIYMNFLVVVLITIAIVSWKNKSVNDKFRQKSYGLHIASK
jgi:hypothetical protein